VQVIPGILEQTILIPRLSKSVCYEWKFPHYFNHEFTFCGCFCEFEDVGALQDSCFTVKEPMAFAESCEYRNYSAPAS